MARVEEVKTSDGESGRSEPLSGPPPWPSPPLPPGTPPKASGRSPRPPLKLSARREAPSESRLVGRTIVKIDTRTVFVVSLLFYLCGLVVVLVAGIVLWIVASLAGGINSIDHFIQQLFGYKSFNLIGIRVLLVTIVAGIVVTLLGTLVNVVIAAVFNLVSDVVGGIRIAVVEERSERQPLV
ncbi:MAG: hypothetical protein E6G01_04005 [Actinobacteria bacterium]|nr:MAG: hypothetical protein E6G01_04005 [Actinomycetota bacterium]